MAGGVGQDGTLIFADNQFVEKASSKENMRLFISKTDNLAYLKKFDGSIISFPVSLPIIPKEEKKFLFPENKTVFAVGDSITLGIGDTSHGGYINALCSKTNTILINKAVSGRGSYRSITESYENNPCNVNKYINTWMSGFNDYRRGGSNIKTINKNYCALSSFIVNSFIKEAIPVSDISIIKTGTWNTFPSGLIGDMAGHIGGSPMRSNASGSTLSYDFTGTSIVVGYWGTDGVIEKGGVVTIKIDGVVFKTEDSNGLCDGINDGSDPNTRIQSVFCFTNLLEGSHNISITVDSVTPGGNLWFDYFATLEEPQNCSTVLVYDIPKMNSAGYAESPSNASDLIFNLGDDNQHNVVNKFKEYPVVIIKTNDFYNISSGISSDNIHPNEKGFSQILEASLINVLQTSPVPKIPDVIINTSENDPTQNAEVNVNLVKAGVFRIGNAYISFTADNLQISVNRDLDGNLIDPSKVAPIIDLHTGPSLSTGAYMRFSQDDGVSGVSEVFKINGGGHLEMAINRYLYLNGAKETTINGIRFSATGNDFKIEKNIAGSWIVQNSSISYVSDAGNFNTPDINNALKITIDGVDRYIQLLQYP